MVHHPRPGAVPRGAAVPGPADIQNVLAQQLAIVNFLAQAAIKLLPQHVGFLVRMHLERYANLQGPEEVSAEPEEVLDLQRRQADLLRAVCREAVQTFYSDAPPLPSFGPEDAVTIQTLLAVIGMVPAAMSLGFAELVWQYQGVNSNISPEARAEAVRRMSVLRTIAEKHRPRVQVASADQMPPIIT